MNHTSKQPVLPALTADLLQESDILIDNVFAKLWQQIGMKTILNRARFNMAGLFFMYRYRIDCDRNFRDLCHALGD